ncbi:MAG: hypothetical protein U5R14_14655 [Gemmatimonadota bacterium]|nr:hypothetical protein [Gemmatimonadota bacterium]
MAAARQERNITRRANDLYWSSDESVNRIAERLDLSKSGLYGMIGPLAAGVECPICGAEVAYPNRTARDRDVLECPDCGWEGAYDETVESREESTGGGMPGSVSWHDRDRKRIVFGGALIGAAAGLAVVRLLRRGR